MEVRKESGRERRKEGRKEKGKKEGIKEGLLLPSTKYFKNMYHLTK